MSTKTAIYKLWKCQNNQWNIIIIKVFFRVGKLSNLYAISNSDFILKVSLLKICMYHIFRNVYYTQRMCQIDMSSQKNDNIHKSVTGFPFKISVLAICHLAHNNIPSLLESPLHHKMARSLETTPHRLVSCLSMRFCQWEVLLRDSKANRREVSLCFFSASGGA